MDVMILRSFRALRIAYLQAGKGKDASTRFSRPFRQPSRDSPRRRRDIGQVPTARFPGDLGRQSLRLPRVSERTSPSRRTDFPESVNGLPQVGERTYPSRRTNIPKSVNERPRVGERTSPSRRTDLPESANGLARVGERTSPSRGTNIPKSENEHPRVGERTSPSR